MRSDGDHCWSCSYPFLISRVSGSRRWVGIARGEWVQECQPRWSVQPRRLRQVLLGTMDMPVGKRGTVRASLPIVYDAGQQCNKKEASLGGL